MDKTKGLFAVIDTQPDASRDWNKAAYSNALEMQNSFANYAAEHPDLPKGDVRVDDLQASARLLSAIDGGMSLETISNIKNGEMDAAQALTNAQEAYEFKKDILRSAFAYGKGGETSVHHQITQAQYAIASRLFHDGNPHIDDRFFDETTGKLKSPNQISESDWSVYDAQLTASLADHPEISAMLAKFRETFAHNSGHSP